MIKKETQDMPHRELLQHDGGNTVHPGISQLLCGQARLN